MKKNKLLASLLALGVSAATCLSLAACGEKEEKPEKPEEPEEPQTLVSDKVTQSEWDKAFADESFSNVKVEMVDLENEKWEEEGQVIAVKYDVKSSYLAADGKEYGSLYAKTTETVGGESETTETREEEYGLKANGKHYRFAKDENGKRSMSIIKRSILSESMSTWYDMKGAFEEFSYSEEAGAYIAKNEVTESNNIDVTCTAKIKGGKLMYFVYDYRGVPTEVENWETWGCVTFTFTYGGQSVELAGAPTAQDVCGKFGFYELDFGGKTVHVGDPKGGDMEPTEYYTKDYITCTFGADGTATFQMEGEAAKSGTYEVNGYLITITAKKEKIEFVWRDSGEISCEIYEDAEIILKK